MKCYSRFWCDNIHVKSLREKHCACVKMETSAVVIGTPDSINVYRVVDLFECQ